MFRVEHERRGQLVLWVLVQPRQPAQEADHARNVTARHVQQVIPQDDHIVAGGEWVAFGHFTLEYVPEVKNVRVVFVLQQRGGLHHKVQNHTPGRIVPLPPDVTGREALPLKTATFDRDRLQDSAPALGTVMLETLLAQSAARFDVVSNHRPLASHHDQVFADVAQDLAGFVVNSSLLRAGGYRRQRCIYMVARVDSRLDLGLGIDLNFGPIQIGRPRRSQDVDRLRK